MSSFPRFRRRARSAETGRIAKYVAQPLFRPPPRPLSRAQTSGVGPRRRHAGRTCRRAPQKRRELTADRGGATVSAPRRICSPSRRRPLFCGCIPGPSTRTLVSSAAGVCSATADRGGSRAGAWTGRHPSPTRTSRRPRRASQCDAAAPQPVMAAAAGGRSAETGLSAQPEAASRRESRCALTAPAASPRGADGDPWTRRWLVARPAGWAGASLIAAVGSVERDAGAGSEPTASLRVRMR